jgi:hypothetical protein
MAAPTYGECADASQLRTAPAPALAADCRPAVTGPPATSAGLAPASGCPLRAELGTTLLRGRATGHGRERHACRHITVIAVITQQVGLETNGHDRLSFLAYLTRAPSCREISVQFPLERGMIRFMITNFKSRGNEVFPAQRPYESNISECDLGHLNNSRMPYCARSTAPGNVLHGSSASNKSGPRWQASGLYVRQPKRVALPREWGDTMLLYAIQAFLCSLGGIV